MSRPPERDRVCGRCEHAPLSAGEAAQIAPACRDHLSRGRAARCPARSRARRRARDRRPGRRAAASRGVQGRRRSRDRSARRSVRRSSRTPAGAVVAGDEQALVPADRPTSTIVFAAGRRAEVEHALAGPGRDGVRDDLRGLVLNEQLIARSPQADARARRAAATRVRCHESRGFGARAVAVAAVASSRPRRVARSDRTVTAGVALLNRHHAFGGLESVAIQPPATSHAGGTASSTGRRAASRSAAPGRARRGSGRRSRVRRNVAQHGVDEAGRARLAERSRQIRPPRARPHGPERGRDARS